MNRWEGRGGLVRTPQIDVTAAGAPRWRATLAVNGTRWDSKVKAQVVKTAYIALTAWGYAAEQASELRLDQGDEVLVVGELDQFEQEVAEGRVERKTGVVVLTLTPIRIKAPYVPKGRREDDPWA